MWVFTIDGFYSIASTEFCQPGELAVRARSKDDLERLLARLGMEDEEILELGEADYRYRVHIPRGAIADYLADSIHGIEYGNFKAACQTAGLEPAKLLALHKIWAVCFHEWKGEAEPED